MRKLTTKLLISVLSVTLALAALGTTTFAWFSMNNKVTVTGMEVKTKVSNNLFVATTTLDATDPVADANFGPSYNYTAAATLLEPASSIDGKAFWYTDSKTNVSADGSVKTATYSAYDSEDTSGFVAANGAAGSVAYMDYVMELKAVNATASATTLDLTKLDLAYKGVNATEKAFRVAIFAEKYNGTDYAMVSLATLPDATSIFSPETSSYFTASKAVNSASTVDTVLTPNSAVSLEVGANKTEYYKIIVRIWLEGEDTTCNNDTFASLNSSWVLDLEFTLGGTAITKLGQAEIAATATGVTLSDGKLSNNETPNSYQWYNAATNEAVAGATTVAAPGATTEDVSYYCVVTTILGNKYISDTITVAKSTS